MFDNRQTLFSSFNFTFIFLIIKQNTFQMICFVKNCTRYKLFALKFHWLAMSVKISNFYIIWSRDKAIFSFYTKATFRPNLFARKVNNNWIDKLHIKIANLRSSQSNAVCLFIVSLISSSNLPSFSSKTSTGLHTFLKIGSPSFTISLIAIIFLLLTHTLWVNLHKNAVALLIFIHNIINFSNDFILKATLDSEHNLKTIFILNFVYW